MERTYRVTVTDEIKASSPQTAVRVLLHRLQSEWVHVVATEVNGEKEHCVEVLCGQVVERFTNPVASEN